MDKYTDKQKDVLTLGGTALFFLTLAMLAASVAVGIIYGAGYGFGLFAASALIVGLYLYLCTVIKAYRLKKSQERYREMLSNMIPTTLDASADTNPTFTVIKVDNDE